MDAFMAMLPARFFDDPDGMLFETIGQAGKPSVVIRTGPVAGRCLAGMRQAVAAMAAVGNDLIVDDVMIGDEDKEYERLLAPYRLFRIGVICPLDVLEARERARGDRAIGLARWQFDRVHRNRRYDLEIDTSKATPLQCAERIRKEFGL
jgi:chloramphenicol 3-O phosphotransferase